MHLAEHSFFFESSVLVFDSLVDFGSFRLQAISHGCHRLEAPTGSLSVQRRVLVQKFYVDIGRPIDELRHIGLSSRVACIVDFTIDVFHGVIKGGLASLTREQLLQRSQSEAPTVELSIGKPGVDCISVVVELAQSCERLVELLVIVSLLLWEGSVCRILPVHLLHRPPHPTAGTDRWRASSLRFSHWPSMTLDDWRLFGWMVIEKTKVAKSSR